MLEKNAKISVLRTMIGLGEEIEPHFIVPQNSISNIRQKMGLSERTGITSTPTPTLIPLENSLRSTQPATVKCPHCESMAKNFLYLESLIRNNYNPKSQCGLCYSSLKYLQYVNKSIMQVFGNFESIANAANTFTGTHRPRAPIASAPVRDTRAITAKSPAKVGAAKKSATKKQLKDGVKVSRPVLQTNTKSVSNARLAGGAKHVAKARSHHAPAKHKTKNNKKASNARLPGGFDGKRKKSALTKPQSVKQKNAKTKTKHVKVNAPKTRK
ncbi:uncharacterized protein LOC105211382 [Zeugodacus cucurbitae]|uniref:uncharacterized protein LOC105211382 n=1 Tax=Zeugodacus cucurbitae TaxID=28588 RepID=UPI0023D95D14|nr:uncharacterized protein LOC105211382 [Zeugodacus cucurbitae]